MTETSKTRTQIPLAAWIIFIIMCLIFGTTFLAIKIGSNAGVPPFLAGGIRFVVSGALILCVKDGPWSGGLKFSGQYTWRAAVLGVLIIGLTFAATYVAAEFIDSGRIAQIQAVSPVLIAVFSVAFLRTRLRPQHGVGLAVGFGGTLLLVGSAGGFGESAFWGALAAFGAEISYALGSIWYRKAFGPETDSVRTNGYSMLFGGLFLLTLALITGQTRFPVSVAALGSIAYLILFGSIGAHSMYLWLVGRVTPLFASTWLFVSPVIATVLGSIVLDEKISIWNVLGAASVLAGVFLIQRAERQA